MNKLLTLKKILQGNIVSRYLFKCAEKIINFLLKQKFLNQLILGFIATGSLLLFIITYLQTRTGFWFLVLFFACISAIRSLSSKNRLLKDLGALLTIGLYLGLSFCGVVVISFYLIIKSIWL